MDIQEKESLVRSISIRRSDRRLIILIVAIAVFLLVATYSVVMIRSTEHSETGMQTSSNVTPAPAAAGPYNGIYVFDTRSPYYRETVTISSSTAESIGFELFAESARGDGGYTGTASRVGSSTTSHLVFESDSPKVDTGGDENNGTCHVSIEFIDATHLRYVVHEFEDASKYTNQQQMDCASNLGIHASFASHVLFEKGGKITLPTIQQLGFTVADIAVFDSLVPNPYGVERGLVSEAQRYLDVGNNDSGLAQVAMKLDTHQFANSIGYVINTPDVVSARDNCDYTQKAEGYTCLFVAIMKDARGHYWILGGSTNDLLVNDGKGFMYATNDPAWKSSLPAPFSDALAKIGVPKSSVVYEK